MGKKKDETEKKPVGRPPKFTDVEEMQEKIAAYFKMCDEKKKPYTISGLALSLGCDRHTLLNYEQDKNKAEFIPTIKKAKQKCQTYAEECLYTNRQVAGVIFSLKNNYGWVDKQELEHSGKLEYELVLPGDMAKG